jgi:hypothetical protein
VLKTLRQFPLDPLPRQSQHPLARVDTIDLHSRMKAH